MADASAHDEEVEHFVGTEEFMLCIEERKFQGIDDTTNGIDDAAGQQPEERRQRQSLQQRTEYQDTYPAHSDIDHRRKPLGTSDPAGFYNHAQSSDTPYQCKQSISQLTA